jgi:UDP-glucuronate 4-epimerase
MAVLVTGGAGFIGSHLIEKLLSENKNIICFDNFNNYYEPKIKLSNIAGCMGNPNFVLIEGDIRDTDSLNSLFKTHNITEVVHLAARAGVRPSLEHPMLYQDVNVKGTINLLEIVRIYGVRNFVFGSSSSVYGINSKVPFNENDKIDKPVSPYAATKRAAELLCFTYHHLYDIPITCLRFFTVYGPRQRPDMAIHKFTRLIDQGKEITMFGDGKSKRDYTYVADIIDGIVTALYNPFGFEIFNLGDSKTVELQYLVSLIEKNLDKKAIIKRLPDQPGDVPITYADISKASDLLSYQPKVSIEEGIEKFVSWFKLELVY